MAIESAAPAPAAEAPASTGNDTEHVGGFETVSEDDKIIEDIRKEARDAKDKEPSPAPKAPAKKPASTAKTPADAPAAGKTPAPSDGEDTERTSAPNATVEAITKAFEAGDVDALARLTGKPKSFFQLNDAKWTTFRAEQAQVRQQAAQVKQGQAKLESDKAIARKEYGRAIAASRAYQDGDYEKFAELVGQLAGEDYDVAQRKVIEGHIALDPNTKALRKQLKEQQTQIEELRNPKPKPAPEATAEQRQQAYGNAIRAVQSELTNHPIVKVRGFENLVLEKVRDSWSPGDNAYTLGFEEAADAVIEERRAEAEGLGFAAKHPSLAQRPPVRREPSVPSRARAADARSADGERWMKEDLDDDEIIASLEADRKAGRLR